MFCRTFPFSFRYLSKDEHQGETEIEILYTEKGKQFCPGIGKNSPLINMTQWKNIGEQALEELNRNYFIMQKWNEGVEESKIEPSVKRFLLMLFED